MMTLGRIVRIAVGVCAVAQIPLSLRAADGVLETELSRLFSDLAITNGCVVAHASNLTRTGRFFVRQESDNQVRWLEKGEKLTLLPTRSYLFCRGRGAPCVTLVLSNNLAEARTNIRETAVSMTDCALYVEYIEEDACGRNAKWVGVKRNYIISLDGRALEVEGNRQFEFPMPFRSMWKTDDEFLAFVNRKRPVMDVCEQNRARASKMRKDALERSKAFLVSASVESLSSQGTNVVCVSGNGDVIGTYKEFALLGGSDVDAKVYGVAGFGADGRRYFARFWDNGTPSVILQMPSLVGNEHIYQFAQDGSTRRHCVAHGEKVIMDRRWDGGKAVDILAVDDSKAFIDSVRKAFDGYKALNPWQ